MKNFKTFCNSLKKITRPPPLPGKSFLHFWNKYFWTKIYRNVQTFGFQVLREYAGIGRLEMIQCKCFFLAPTRNIFLVLCRGIFFIIFSKLRIVKWGFLSETVLLKWVMSFPCFFKLWNFLPKNRKLVDKLQIWGF